jgi:hypothetical protein
MSTKAPRQQRTFSPLLDKALSSVLRQVFVTEFGYDKSVYIADAMISRILKVIDAYVKPSPLLKPGQFLWMAVRNDGQKHTFKAMKDTPQVPVILDLLTNDDVQALANDEDFVTIRRRRHARLLDQALAQGGVLAQSDLSAITLTPERHVRADITRVQETEERILPHRGSVQDIGPTCSHKVEVARLLEAGFLEPEICRKLSPVHNLRSVERYAQTYKNVSKLLERSFAPTEICGILTLSNRLVNTYIEIVEEHHPDIIAANPHTQDRVTEPGSLPT